MAAVFLAAKVEESARRAQDVVNVFVHLKQTRNGGASEPLDPASKAFDTWKGALFLTEAAVLKELGYDMYGLNCHPHRFVLFFVEILRGPPELAQCAWSYTNDIFRLDAVACAAILAAAQDFHFGLPQSPPWTALLCPHTPPTQLLDIVTQLRALYATPAPAWLPSLRPEQEDGL